MKSVSNQDHAKSLVANWQEYIQEKIHLVTFLRWNVRHYKSEHCLLGEKAKSDNLVCEVSIYQFRETHQ